MVPFLSLSSPGNELCVCANSGRCSSIRCICCVPPERKNAVVAILFRSTFHNPQHQDGHVEHGKAGQGSVSIPLIPWARAMCVCVCARALGQVLEQGRICCAPLQRNVVVTLCTGAHSHHSKRPPMSFTVTYRYGIRTSTRAQTACSCMTSTAALFSSSRVCCKVYIRRFSDQNRRYT